MNLTIISCTIPQNLTESGITSTTATLSWDLVPGSWGYVVMHRQVGSAWVFDTVNTNSLSLTTLNSGATHKWRVYSLCTSSGSSVSSWSSIQTFTTGSCNISLSTSSVNVLCNLGSTGSIDLSVVGGSGVYTYLWSDGSTSEDISSLSAGVYSVTVTDSWGCTESTSVTILENMSITSFNPQTICSGDSYSINGNTYTTSGTYTDILTASNGCDSTVTTVLTIITVSAPTTLSTINISSTQATLVWSSVLNSDHYDVRYRVQGSSWTLVQNLTTLSTILNGLSVGSSYDWEVRSACSSDSSSVSSWSSTETFATPYPCTIPQNLTESGITSTTATLSWDLVPGSWGYVVMHRQVGSAWVFDTVNTNSLSLTTLNSAATHKWRVYSLCTSSGSSVSSWSSIQTFTTGSCNISLSTSSVNVLCNLGSTGSIDLSVVGGSGVYTYLWSDGSTSEDISSLSAGVYSVTVTDSWGCTESTSVTILENMSITSFNPQTICSGDSYSINGNTYTTSGTYTDILTASNGCDSTVTTVLTIITVSAPTTLSTINISFTQATLVWSSVLNSDHYDVRYRVQGSSWTLVQNLTTLSTILNGLSVGSSYDWEVRSACSSDSSSVSSWSSTESFATPYPCTIPQNLTESGITSTTATLSWDLVPGSWGYVVMHRQVGSAWVFDTVNTNSLSLTTLNSGATHKWRVYSLCTSSGSSVSSWSSIQTFTTGSCNISLSTSSVNVLCNLGSTGSIDLSVVGGSGVYTYLWSDGSTSEDISSLSAGVYSVTVTDSWGCTESTSVTILENMSITSFNPQTICSGDSYSINGNTYTTSGTYTDILTASNGCDSTVTTVLTIITVSAPTTLSTINISFTQATLVWSSVLNSDHYDVRYRVQGSSWTLVQNLTTLSTILNGLSVGSSYDWEVRSACSSDSSSVSSWSSTESFATPYPCTIPQNLTESGITSTTATLSWDLVPGSWGYVVMHRQVGSAWVFDTVNTNSLSLTTLNSGATHKWRVYSLCTSSGSSVSSWSSIQTFTTGSCNISLSTSSVNVLCNLGSTGSIDLSVVGEVEFTLTYGQMDLHQRTLVL